MDHHDAQAPGTITIFLADDNPIVREGVRALIDGHADLQVVGMAGDYGEAVSGATAANPQVLATGIRMPPGFQREGIDAAKEVRNATPGRGSWCCLSTRTPNTRSLCWPRARPSHTGPLDNTTTRLGGYVREPGRAHRAR